MNEPIIALDARLIGSRGTGDTTYWSGLVQGFAAIQPKIQILLFSNTPRPAEIPESPKIRWIELPARSSRWWSLAKFPLAARAAGAALVHTQYNMSPMVKRGVTTVHDVSFFIGPEWFKPRDRYFLSRFVPKSAQRAVRVITVSETSKRDIARFMPGVENKTRVTPLACSPGIRRVDADSARTVAKGLGLDGPFLLTVGTRWPRKNMGLAVAAADLLSSDLPHRLAVTGQSGWGEQDLGGRGFATGYVTDEQLSALYSAADLYVAPSHYEGFGLPLLEAFRCGCPVLCSSGGSLPEVAGGAARVEETWAPEHWSGSIERLLEDDREREELRRRGFERESGFTWERTAAETEAVYREALLQPVD